MKKEESVFLSSITMAFTKFILLITVYMCVRYALGTAYMWRSGDNSVMLVPFLYGFHFYMGSELAKQMILPDEPSHQPWVLKKRG